MDIGRIILNRFQTRHRPAVVIAAGVLIQVTMGTGYTFGNMLPYLVSYLRAKVDPMQTKGSLIWIQTAVSGIPFAMLLGGYCEKKLGPRRGSLLGSIVASSGIALSFYTIKHSFGLLLFTYGFLFGLGQGIAYMSVLICAQKWLPRRIGLAGGLTVAGFGCGGFVFSPVQTKFINPNNYAPNKDGFFTQEDLLERIPYVFLVLGGLYICIQLFGAVFLVTPGLLDALDYQTDESSDEEKALLEEEDWSLTVAQTLKTATFWSLFIALFFLAIWSMTNSGLYKAFGQTFIADDLFLAFVGSMASAVNAISRILWGLLADRVGFQVSFSIVSTLAAAMMWTFTSTPIFGNVSYLFWVCTMFACNGGIYTLMPFAVNKCFGSKHFGLNYGMMKLALPFSGVTTALMTQHLLPILNFHRIYLMVGLFAYIAFFFAITLHCTSHGTKRPRVPIASINNYSRI